MTEQEHKLVVFMLAQQHQRLIALVEALKSKGVLEPDDIDAYERLIYSKEDSSPRLFSAVCEQYEIYAKALGVQVDLKNRDKEENPKLPK